MKKKIVVLLAGAMTMSMLLTGCSGNQAKTEYVTVGGYKGIEVEDIEEAEVKDEDVENYINAILAQHATVEQIKDRAAADGDTVNVDFVGTMDGVEFDGGSTNGQGYSLQIGAGNMIEGFEESVIGHMPGETYNWDGQFPDSYSMNPDFSGKPVTFAITLNYIEGETSFPELTDEMVKTLSEKSKTVEEYKEEVRKLLEENNKEEYDYNLEQAAWDAVLEKAEVTYPEDEKEEMLQMFRDAYTQAAEAEGVELEEYLSENYGMTMEDFEEQIKNATEASLKERLVLEAIAEEENLMPTGKELEKGYEQIAEDYGYESVEALKEASDEETLKLMVVQPIVREWLAEHAVQVKK